MDGEDNDADDALDDDDGNVLLCDGRDSWCRNTDNFFGKQKNADADNNGDFDTDCDDGGDCDDGDGVIDDDVNYDDCDDDTKKSMVIIV